MNTILHYTNLFQAIIARYSGCPVHLQHSTKKTQLNCLQVLLNLFIHNPRFNAIYSSVGYIIIALKKIQQNVVMVDSGYNRNTILHNQNLQGCRTVCQ